MQLYIQSGDYEATELDGEWIILNTEQLTVTKLNEMGGFCWSLLKSEQSPESLTHSVLKEFSTNSMEEQIQLDMTEFLANLYQLGLVRTC